MRKLLALTAPIAAFGAFVTPALAASYISNGTFSGPNPGTTQNLIQSSAIPGWSTGGFTTWVEGQSLQLSGTVSSNTGSYTAGGSASTLLTGLTTGIQYNVSFNLVALGSSSPQDVGVTAGNQVGPLNTGAEPYVAGLTVQTDIYKFIASGSTETLTFGSLGTNALLTGGPVLSDVRVAVVPESGTWAMMIIGFGLVGIGMRRRARRVGHEATGGGLAFA